MTARRGTLFVIEDDPQARNAVVALARSMRITCVTFASAERFLDGYNPSLMGCVLVDYRLGGMNGLQLQERLQSLHSNLAVILISACGDASVAARALGNGAVAYIEKPYQDDQLADAVRKAVDGCLPSQQPSAVEAAPRPPGQS